MSMVIGYAYGKAPTYTEADIDQMYEAESARIWEDKNAPDPNERKHLAAVSSLKLAVALLEDVTDYISQGAQEAEGLPLEKKLEFYIGDFEDRICDLKRIIDKAERCEED